MKDHFIIIGAQRSGTTYLYEILNGHPEICMAQPVRPEPKYFMAKDEADIKLEDYHRLFFNHCPDQTRIFGEKSTSYYEKKESAKLIAKVVPNVKIIFLLRNPVERALSNYFFSVNNGLETRTLNDVFLKKKAPPKNDSMVTSVDPFDYLGRGEYAKFIKRFGKYFSSDYFKILIFEELVNNMEQMRELFSFLGVNKDFITFKMRRRINPALRTQFVSKEITDELKNFYLKPNKELENLIGQKLFLWK